MADRTIVMAQNGRHGMRGVSARNPSEFEAYHDPGDNLTYTVDMAAYLGTDTISSVTRTPYGLTVSNASNTTTTLTQRLTGFGYVDIKVSTAGGDSERFRIYIEQRTPTGLSQGVDDYIEVPVATTATRDPTTSDDSTLNFVAGNLWINTATLNKFTCIANTAGAARWRHEPRILAQSFASVSCPADTTEDTLATVTVPADTMGANGVLLVDTLWTFTNSANNKTLQVHFGGVSGSAYLSIIHTTLLTARHLTRIANANSTSAQVGMPGGKDSGVGSSTGALTTGVVDTTASTTIVITGQKQSAGETLTLSGYTVTLTRPDIS